MSKHSAKPRRKRTVMACALVVAVTLVAVGVRGFWDRHEAVTRTQASGGSPVGLDESPMPLEECTAAADEPKSISLGSLNVEGCIERVGATRGQIDSPENIHVAGWFDQSALPGDAGLSIIDGHSSGRYTDGIFNRIDQFDPGSIFTVEYGDGSIRRFEVTSVQSHPVSATMERLYADANQQQANLALITCGGDYDAARHSYDKRVVVLAVTI